jgi:predicted nucleic acid-binding protein
LEGVKKTVVLDACVLYPAVLCDTLLRMAELDLFRPRWTETILQELARALEERIGSASTAHRIGTMRGAFPDADIEGHEHLISEMTNHPKDRHVLAAAVACGADVIVTDYLSDFPAVSTAPHRIVVQSADQFLLDLYAENPASVERVLREQAAANRYPPQTVPDLLVSLAVSAPTTSALIAERMG